MSYDAWKLATPPYYEWADGEEDRYDREAQIDTLEEAVDRHDSIVGDCWSALYDAQVLFASGEAVS